MQDGIQTSVKSITTGSVQTLYLSKHDADLMKGKRVAIVDATLYDKHVAFKITK